MNENQKRACAILDAMLSRQRMKAVIPPRSSEDLLPSPEKTPDTNTIPASWCDGWAFALPPALGSALDCIITDIYETKIVCNEDGNPIQDTDKNGVPLFYKVNSKKLGVKKGEPIPKRIQIKIGTKWTQGTEFAFREGYTMHGVDSNGIACIQVKAANKSSPACGGNARDPGLIELLVYRPDPSPNGCWKYETTLTMTQDQLVRLCITGEQS
jgi:hypothetical protein